MPPRSQSTPHQHDWKCQNPQAGMACRCLRHLPTPKGQQGQQPYIQLPECHGDRGVDRASEQTLSGWRFDKMVQSQNAKQKPGYVCLQADTSFEDTRQHSEQASEVERSGA